MANPFLYFEHCWRTKNELNPEDILENLKGFHLAKIT